MSAEDNRLTIKDGFPTCLIIEEKKSNALMNRRAVYAIYGIHRPSLWSISVYNRSQPKYSTPASKIGW